MKGKTGGEKNRPIRTVKDLQTHLEQACQVEMSTIPMYLYALYSLQSQIEAPLTTTSGLVDPGMSAYGTIRGVVIEEMLHLTLARNLLWAVGGANGRNPFRFYSKSFVPTYPSPMLHRKPKLVLHLRQSSKPQIGLFLKVEKPEVSDQAPPESGHYQTIGQFYKAIQDGFWYLDQKDPVALWGDGAEKKRRGALQLSSGDVYWNSAGGGNPILVQDLASACEAIKTIVEQGEGYEAGRNTAPLDFDQPPNPVTNPSEYSHFERFRQIEQGIDQMGTVSNLVDDPKLAQYGGSLRQLAELFNACYCYVLLIIDALYENESAPFVAGQPNREWQLIQALLTAMGALLYPIAALIVQQPVGSSGRNAGPTFEYYDFGKSDPQQHLLELCDAVSRDYPGLGGDNSVRSFIVKLPAVAAGRVQA